MGFRLHETAGRSGANPALTKASSLANFDQQHLHARTVTGATRLYFSPNSHQRANPPQYGRDTERPGGTGCGPYLQPAIKKVPQMEMRKFMKAVFALIVIYVGTFLVAIQGASNTSVEASEQNGAQASAAIDPVKEKEIRSLLELVGARDAIQDAASSATEQYRQKMLETSANNKRAQALTNAYLAEFQKKFDADTVSNQLVGIYDKRFTEDEIKDLLEFYGSPLGQKVAAEMPKITREAQLATRAASTQAARLAWQELRAEYPNAGENLRALDTRRRNPNANTPAQPLIQPSGTQQALGDSQQP